MNFIDNFQTILSLIVIFGTAVTTIGMLITKFGKPFRERREKYQREEDEKVRKRIDDELIKVLPDIMRAHDLEVRDRYRSDRERYLQEIKEEVICNIRQKLNSIDNLQVNMEVMIQATKDVLREKIMALYHKRKSEKFLYTHEREALTEWYKDYKAMKGNSYIDKYYGRMNTWEVKPDDYE